MGACKAGSGHELGHQGSWPAAALGWGGSVQWVARGTAGAPRGAFRPAKEIAPAPARHPEVLQRSAVRLRAAASEMGAWRNHGWGRRGAPKPPAALPTAPRDICSVLAARSPIARHINAPGMRKQAVLRSANLGTGRSRSVTCTVACRCRQGGGGRAPSAATRLQAGAGSDHTTRTTFPAPQSTRKNQPGAARLWTRAGRHRCRAF